MSTYKESIDALLVRLYEHPDVQSTGYGEPEAYDVSKSGVLYPRAYLSLVEVIGNDYSLELVVTKAVASDQSNRLQVQSDTLTIIKSLVQTMKADDGVIFDTQITYEPTRLYQRDQSEGFKITFSLRSDEVVECIDNLIP